MVSGGFPCQDVSAIGHGKGLSGKRSGLWFQFARIIDEVRPRFAFVENSPVLRKRGLDQVLANLAEIGYDAEWLVLGADDCGIPQKRKRMWVLAYPHRIAEQESFGNNQTLQQERNTWVGVEGSGDRRRIPMSYAAVAQFAEALSSQSPTRGSLQLNASEPGMGRVVNDVANRVDRLTAIGNGQVPAVAATAWTILMDRIYKN